MGLGIEGSGQALSHFVVLLCAGWVVVGLPYDHLLCWLIPRERNFGVGVVFFFLHPPLPPMDCCGRRRYVKQCETVLLSGTWHRGVSLRDMDFPVGH